MQAQIFNIIKDAVLEIKESFYTDLFDTGIPSDEIILFDEEDGVLNSLELVSLIFIVEDKLQDLLGFHITLTEDRALSKDQSSFRTLGAFQKYILTIIEKH